MLAYNSHAVCGLVGAVDVVCVGGGMGGGVIRSN